MARSSQKKRSAWRQVVDACPERAAHLRSAIRGRVEATDGCRVQDDWNVGLDAVLECLAHTFALTDEDVEELRSDIDWDLQRPDWVSRERETELRPPYQGGHPRIPTGEGAGGFPAFDDLEELIWSRGSELMDAPSRSVARIDYVGEDGETEWSRPLDCRELAGTGYLTISSVNEDDSYVEAVIGLWSPFDDRDAMAKAIAHGYDAWDDDNPWASAKTVTASDSALWAAVVALVGER